MWLLLIFLLCSSVAQAADIKTKLQGLQQEQARINQVKAQLEQQLGALGKELRTLDMAIVQASRDKQGAAQKISATDSRILELRKERDAIFAEVRTLNEQMALEVESAWKRRNASNQWLNILNGGSVTELPHRQKLIAMLVGEQQRVAIQRQKLVDRLSMIEREQVLKRSELAALKTEQELAVHTLASRANSKKELLQRTRGTIGAQQQRARELLQQEANLRRLLNELARVQLPPPEPEPAKTGSSGKPLPTTPLAQPGGGSIRGYKGKLPWPSSGAIVVGYGQKPNSDQPALKGVHIAPPSGSMQVRAVAAGRVRYSDFLGGMGLMMIVDHGDALFTIYAHNETMFKKIGDSVAAGEVIATAGSTGWVESPRLYFEVDDRGHPVNPTTWCRK